MIQGNVLRSVSSELMVWLASVYLEFSPHSENSVRFLTRNNAFVRRNSGAVSAKYEKSFCFMRWCAQIPFCAAYYVQLSWHKTSDIFEVSSIQLMGKPKVNFLVTSRDCCTFFKIPIQFLMAMISNFNLLTSINRILFAHVLACISPTDSTLRFPTQFR